jgi:hypothetical protein
MELAECLFLFGIGFDDDWVLSGWFVFFPDISKVSTIWRKGQTQGPPTSMWCVIVTI